MGRHTDDAGGVKTAAQEHSDRNIASHAESDTVFKCGSESRNGIEVVSVRSLSKCTQRKFIPSRDGQVAVYNDGKAASGNLTDRPEKRLIPDVRDSELQVVDDGVLIDFGIDETRAQERFRFRREKENGLRLEV
jgi:hypothetical protein